MAIIRLQFVKCTKSLHLSDANFLWHSKFCHHIKIFKIAAHKVTVLLYNIYSIKMWLHNQAFSLVTILLKLSLPVLSFVGIDNNLL
jgi:hypothetical protein